MSERRRSIREALADHAAMDEAIRKAMREAVVRAARLGHAVPVWQDGEVVWITPAEVLAQIANVPVNGGAPPEDRNGLNAPLA